MSYVALYRKFRPQTFDQLKGQEHVVTALKNQLRQGRIGHSYLFTGTRGTGKTSAARILAKAVNCLHPQDGEPCNACENCLAVNAGNFADVTEVDAASNNGVDDIRRLIEEVRYTPVMGRYKVYIIDEAHMITGAAFNAFLKTLEEPPSYAVFILATTEPHKLPVTILSRCQRYDFHRITVEEIAGNLEKIVQAEGVEAEEKALRYIARAGDGSMRDAISLLDKCIAFHLGNALTYDNVLDTLGSVDTEVFSRLFQSVYQGNVPAALGIIDQAAADGRDLTQFSGEWIRYIRNVLMIRAAGIQDPEVLGVSRENMRQLSEDAEMADQTVLIRYIQELSELLNRLRYSPVKQILLETCVIRLAVPGMETDLSSLTDRIRHLEQKLKDGNLPDAAVSSQKAPARQIPPVSTVSPSDPMEAYPELFADLMDEQPYKASYVQPSGPQPSENDGLYGRTEERTNLWQRMTEECPQTRIRFTMKKCTAAFSGSEDSDTSHAVLEVFAPNVVLMKQLQEEDTRVLLQDLAGRLAGETVEIRIVQGTGPKGSGDDMAADPFPEELLHNINMTIGTEEY